MKDKPFGFQIWMTMTAFLVFITCIVTLVLINYLSFDLLKNLIRILLVISIVNIGIAKIITNKITEPLRDLERKVRQIANKEWAEPIRLNRSDEFGKLATSINMMQDSLKKMEMDEEIFLQNVSHDLKTPIMVIRSYAQALSDGVYLNDSLEDTVAIIEKEAVNLEQKVEKLLYLNSLDYILERKNERHKLNLKALLEQLSRRFALNSHHHRIETSLQDAFILGNEDELTVALENILENNLRYASTTIHISTDVCLYQAAEHVQISILNDGPLIEEEVLHHLFNHFYKGKNGKFGLGLFISQKIIQFHGGHMMATNTKAGPLFTILLPV
ncbi:sensor histidine kinase [Brevibacillus fluminis]|uniref:histidine kinase n=1 Tax=Brevibacillus fluminis TaxID=511487 RepID=A0A3M8DW44_9BACL|nr:HAMP domain-containing sensor histidine kinase [Brevibacillus fluminis]RNB92403.1 sensor histidine kinase [Brevibacillus fluminis]